TIRSWTVPASNAPTRASGYRILGRLALRLWDVLQLHKESVDQSLSKLLGRFKKHDFSSGQLPISMLGPADLLRLAKESYESAFYVDGSQWELWVQAVVLGWPLGLDKPDSGHPYYNDDVSATQNMAALLAKTADRATTNASAQRALAAAIKF